MEVLNYYLSLLKGPDFIFLIKISKISNFVVKETKLLLFSIHGIKLISLLSKQNETDNLNCGWLVPSIGNTKNLI